MTALWIVLGFILYVGIVIGMAKYLKWNGEGYPVADQDRGDAESR